AYRGRHDRGCRRRRVVRGDARGRVDRAARAAARHPRPRLRLRHRGDSRTLGAPDSRHRFPHGASGPRRRVPEIDRPLGEGMMRGLWQLTWLETKIFVREPLGVFGTVAIPVLMFLVMGRLFGGRAAPAGERVTALLRVQMPILAVLLISLSAVLSLVTVIAIYREA